MRLWPLFACLLISLTASAQVAQQGYQTPPQAVLEAVKTPVPPTVIPNPAQDKVLILEFKRYMKLAEIAVPMVRVANLRIDPASHNTHLATFSLGNDWTSLKVKDLATGAEKSIALPAGMRVTKPTWSPDGRKFAFPNRTNAGTDLWVGDATTGELKQIAGVKVNEIFSPSLYIFTGKTGDEDAIWWMPDSRSLLVRAVPENWGAPPSTPAVPPEPIVQEGLGKKEELVTYPDLLQNRSDEALFEYYTTARLAVVDTESGETRTVGEKAIWTLAKPSPDGRYILATRLQKPYSYIYPWNLFPRQTEVLESTKGTSVYKVASFAQGSTSGPSAVVWHPTRGATLTWIDSIPAAGTTPKKSALFALRAPFENAPFPVFQNELSIRTVAWSENDHDLFVSVARGSWKRETAFFVDASQPGKRPRMLWSVNTEDKYSDHGLPLLRTLPNGYQAMRQDGRQIYLSGEGYSAEGNLPFLDRLNVDTAKAERLWKSDAKTYEKIQTASAADPLVALTRRESPTEAPAFYLLNLNPGALSRTPVASYSTGVASLSKVDRKILTYRRDDGVEMASTLYLPPDYQPGTQVPVIVWAYPTEFLDHDFAGQLTTSPYRHLTAFANFQFYLFAGYAVLDAAMPIIGQPETVNDTLIKQLKDNAEAIVQVLKDSGYSDGKQIGITGHSYGSFMTAHMLAHTDLFRAGIARSGAFNRSLTPFGFQNEARTFWDAPEFYINVSPFTYATKINEPILLIHGKDDQNSGTFPIQSDRLYAAVRGNGGTIRYVGLPLEGHWYMAEESNLTVFAESIRWFDKYVKSGWDVPGFIKDLIP